MNAGDNYLKGKRIENSGEIKSTQTKFTWVINEFANNLHECRSVSSHVFVTITEHAKTQWILTLYPNQPGTHSNHIGIGIKCANRNVIAHVQFAVLNVAGTQCHTKQLGCFEFNKNNSTDGGIGSFKFVNRAIIFGEQRKFYIRNNALRVVCVITTNDTIQTERLNRTEENRRLQKLAEFRKFRQLINDETFADVTFCIGDERIWAHKAILACSSSVFQAMFTHSMAEKNSSVVNVEDVSGQTMRAVLMFVYTGDLVKYTTDTYDRYTKLLIAAEKYCIENLKQRCQEKLVEQLKFDNVLDCIVLADIHNASDLKTAAIDFAAANAEKIVEGPTFDEFMKCDTEICKEVVRVLVTKRRRLN